MNKRLLAFALCALLFTLQCNTITGGNSSAGVPGNIDPDNTIFLVGGQPRTLDPALTHGGPSDAIGAIFSGLVTLDTNLQVQPDLAAGWTVNDDGTIYTFYLRRNALFHDGRPLTAQDIIFSWERAADPATGSDTARTYLGDIVGVKDKLDGRANTISGLRAINDHTLEVRIDAPKVYFLAKLTYPVAFIVDRNNVTQSDWEHRPNGTGPFRLQEWRDDEIIILARNSHFYLDPPSVSHLVYQIGAGIPLSLYETGDIDLVGVGGDTLERIQDPNNPLSAELQTGVDMCTTYIGLNTQAPPFDDPLVRQAFNYALDKERLINTLYSGDALIATGILPPGMPGYTNPGPDRPGYPFDPVKAQELLAQAGYPNGAGFPTPTFYSSGYGEVDLFVAAIITMWQENLAVTIEPVLLDPFIYSEELYGGNAGNIFSWGWCADYPDPENFLDILFHSDSVQNIGRYHNPAVDQLLEQARSEASVAARMALYAQIEQQITADAPVVFFSHSLSAVLVKPHLQNYVLTPIGVAQWRSVQIDRAP
jgi:ABC-type transport system substrate-binding protein